jgi:hypothetical protein
MGKKPVVGLIGLVWAGIALTGCGECCHNNRNKFNPTPKLPAKSQPGDSSAVSMPEPPKPGGQPTANSVPPAGLLNDSTTSSLPPGGAAIPSSVPGDAGRMPAPVPGTAGAPRTQESLMPSEQNMGFARTTSLPARTPDGPVGSPDLNRPAESTRVPIPPPPPPQNGGFDANSRSSKATPPASGPGSTPLPRSSDPLPGGNPLPPIGSSPPPPAPVPGSTELPQPPQPPVPPQPWNDPPKNN